MFSEIVEAKVNLLEYTPDLHEIPGQIQITLERPKEFDDIKVGDSIAVNGICLTVESFTENSMQFTLGAETIKVAGFTEAELRNQKLNVERSLRFNDRIHGHIVTGHVDGMGLIQTVLEKSGCKILQVFLPNALLPYVWKKGSICLNGVSLTVNEVHDHLAEVCLVPETLRRTNFSDIRAGARITVEADQLARGISRMLNMEKVGHELNN